MDAAISAAEALVWPAESVHGERSGAEPRKGDEPFEAVITHLHVDHFGELPLIDCFSPWMGRWKPLRVTRRRRGCRKPSR
jgi:hypothetical protein